MKTKTKFILSLFIISLFLSVLTFFSVFTLKKIKTISREILEKKKEDISYLQRIKNVKEFEEIKKKKGKEFFEIENVLFDKNLPLPFVTFLEEIAKEKQVSIEISTQETFFKEEEDIFPSLYFRLNFSGRPDSVFTFLEKIEKSPFLVQIEKLRISKAKERENLDGEVLIKTFVKE